MSSEIIETQVVVVSETAIDILTIGATPGVGVPMGGTTGQILAKASDTDFDTVWQDETGGGGGVSEQDVIALILAFG